MKISTKGRYALRLMIDLAEHYESGLTALKDVSAREGISIKYLEQIVTQLSKAGLLRSTRGPQGGYRLAKAPDSYTVGDILRVTEGSLAPVACLEDEPNLCERQTNCVTLEVWQGLYQVIETYIDHIRLNDPVERKREKAAYNYSI